VDKYADFLLNELIGKQFNAFYRGFQNVMDESPLKFLFWPEELEQIVCGSKVRLSHFNILVGISRLLLFFYRYLICQIWKRLLFMRVVIGKIHQ